MFFSIVCKVGPNFKLMLCSLEIHLVLMIFFL